MDQRGQYCKIRVVFLYCVQYFCRFNDDELLGGDNRFFQKANRHSLCAWGEHEGGHRDLFFRVACDRNFGVCAVFTGYLRDILFDERYAIRRFSANPVYDCGIPAAACHICVGCHNLHHGKYSSNCAVGKEKTD